MRNDSKSHIRTIARLAAPAVFGLAVLACGGSSDTVESDTGAVSAHRSADALDRSAINASVSTSADPVVEANGTPGRRYL